MGKIVCVGSSGFIGSALVRKLDEFGVDNVTCLPSSSDGPSLHRDADWVLAHLDGADVMYICAGQTGGVGKMQADPMSFVYPNVGIHMNLFRAAQECGVRRVICLQSTTGYPDSDLPMQEHEYCKGELHPAYFVPGNTHRFIYRLSQMFKNIEFLFFRPSNVYGPANDFNPITSHVIEATVRKVLERKDPFVIWGDGSEVRDAVYVDDLAEAMVAGLEGPPGAYNVASGQEMSVKQIVAVLLEHADFAPTIQYDASKPRAISARRLDISRARSLLNWEPQVMMREGLQRTYDWARDNLAQRFDLQ